MAQDRGTVSIKVE